MDSILFVTFYKIGSKVDETGEFPLSILSDFSYLSPDDFGNHNKVIGKESAKQKA